MKFVKFFWKLFDRAPLLAASVTKTDQKKQKDILYLMNIFVETMMQRNISKFNESVFWLWNIIILKLWKTKLEKQFVSVLCSNWIKIFFRATHNSYLSKKLKKRKSDCWFYEWCSVMFQKKDSLSARKEKLVCEASHVSCMKMQLVRNKL